MKRREKQHSYIISDLLREDQNFQRWTVVLKGGRIHMNAKEDNWYESIVAQ